jgi:acetyl esterase
MSKHSPTVIDRLEANLVRVLMRMPPRVQVWLSGRPTVQIDGQTLDPEIQMLLGLRRLAGFASLAKGEPEQARFRLHRDAIVHAGPEIQVQSVRDLTIDGPEGPLRARHYAPPQSGKAQPLLLFLHGGGFVLCDIETHDAACRILCREVGLHVLSVEYRLAPEHRFPAGVEDARAALRWAHANAAQLGADPNRVAIAGDSAGGTLATVATRLAVQEGERPPYAQLLIYPAVDRATPRASLQLFGRGLFLTRRDMDWFNGHVCNADVDLNHPWLSPLLWQDLPPLPPTLVVTAALDPLRDEGEAYADALRAAGTHAVLLRVPHMVHGFINMLASPAARRAFTDVAHAAGELLERAAAAATAEIPQQYAATSS